VYRLSNHQAMRGQLSKDDNLWIGNNHINAAILVSAGRMDDLLVISGGVIWRVQTIN
jgi:hypothetical protein